MLFFDDVHLTQAEGDRAKVALTQFLERELQAGDLVSLVAPGTALRWHARMPDGRPELTRIVSGLRGLYLPDPSSDQMSDYEAYRINAFNDEAVADQVERRWKNARVNGREPANLATDQGFQPTEPRRPDRHHPAGHPDARGRPSTSRPRPATSRRCRRSSGPSTASPRCAAARRC